MASAARYCPSCLSRSSPSTFLRKATAAPYLHHQVRTAVASANAAKYKRKDQPASQKRRKQRTTYLQPDLKNAIQFSLVDAMR